MEMALQSPWLFMRLVQRPKRNFIILSRSDQLARQMAVGLILRVREEERTSKGIESKLYSYILFMSVSQEARDFYRSTEKFKTVLAPHPKMLTSF